MVKISSIKRVKEMALENHIGKGDVKLKEDIVIRELYIIFVSRMCEMSETPKICIEK